VVLSKGRPNFFGLLAWSATAIRNPYTPLKDLNFLTWRISRKVSQIMVVNKAFRATGCAHCRLSLLRAFTSVTGPAHRLQPLAVTRTSRSIPVAKAQYSSQIFLYEHHQDATDIRSTEFEEEEAVKDHIEELEKVNEESIAVSAVPWYLQVQTPSRAPQPLSDRQRIPNLPESPPAILGPLLQEVSIDLGLDNLTLLDLRKLDPPPALGANLLMLIGTARSEKHLHVSADRLCRWLRSNYKLRPDADGLLGRNELKLKLRRKSRRAKLMGSAVDDNGDDGVRTGWVCVDVGVVDGPETNGDDIHPAQGFVGFGRRTDGVKIVVQMLTEEKRVEIDLERLWGGILRRGTIKELDDIVQAGTEDTPLTKLSEQLESRVSPILNQTRGFHTSARRLAPESEVSKPLPTSPPIGHTNPAPRERQFDLHNIQQLVTGLLETGDLDSSKYKLSEYHVSQLKDGKWGDCLLEQLRLYLENLPVDRAINALGKGPDDNSSTPFLICFYQILPKLSPQSRFEAKIWLHRYASDLRHTGYTLNTLMFIFRELRLNGIDIPRAAYLDLLRQILRSEDFTVSDESPATSIRMENAMEILQTMYDRGHDILTADILVELQLSAPHATPDAESQSQYHQDTLSNEIGLRNILMTPIMFRTHLLITHIDLPAFTDASRIQIMDRYARLNHWVEFWELWNMAPRRQQPQSAEMYSFMFISIANTGVEKACMFVLRNWISDMDREIPQVKLEGPVAEAVKACLKVADPLVENDANGNPQARGEWIDLWRRCTE
jgi:hypothetical protein